MKPAPSAPTPPQSQPSELFREACRLAMKYFPYYPYVKDCMGDRQWSKWQRGQGGLLRFCEEFVQSERLSDGTSKNPEELSMALQCSTEAQEMAVRRSEALQAKLDPPPKKTLAPEQRHMLDIIVAGAALQVLRDFQQAGLVTDAQMDAFRRKNRDLLEAGVEKDAADMQRISG